MASVRYIVNDVDKSVEFYRDRLSFRVDMHNPGKFAALERDDGASHAHPRALDRDLGARCHVSAFLRPARKAEPAAPTTTPRRPATTPKRPCSTPC